MFVRGRKRGETWGGGMSEEPIFGVGMRLCMKEKVELGL